MLLRARSPLLLGWLLLSACRAAGTSGDGGSGSGDGGTWYHDVLPIVQESCQNCHVPGGIAPFPLVTYQDGSHYAQLMSYALTAGLMPPWKPSPTCQSFHGDRSIPQAWKDVVVNWANSGAAEGNPADAPPPRDGGLPQLPYVSAALDAGRDYTPNAVNGPDDYHCSIIDPGLKNTTGVIGVNIVPGQPSLVHHVILFYTTPAAAQAAQGNDAGLGWTCFGGPGTGDFNMVGGWVPGSPPQVFPSGTGIAVPAGDVLVMQIHYNMSTAGPQPDRTVAQLMYSASPVPKVARIDGPIDLGFSIPPNAQGYSVTYPYQVQANVTVWGVQPHMHTKGTQISVSMTEPSGAQTCLIDIPQWSFSWQQMYFYQSPLTVPANTLLHLNCTWTNPTDQTVTFGEGTADEMCLAFFYYTLN